MSEEGIPITEDTQLFQDMIKLDAMYEELLWEPTDELLITHDGKRVIIINKTREVD